MLEPKIRVSKLRTNPLYSIYYKNIANLIVLGITPLLLLAGLNFRIYQETKKVSRTVQQNDSQTGSLRHRNDQENDLAKVLSGIVITFMCCHALRIFLNIHESITIYHIISCRDSFGMMEIQLWPQIINNFSKLMLVANSPANIIIYGCLNSKFRKKMISLLSNMHHRH